MIEAIAEACGCAVASHRPVAGGDVNSALRAELADGRSVFVKYRDDPAPGFYEAEAAGLAWLAEGPLGIPAVVAARPGFLVLEWIESGARAADFDAAFGAGLARLHALGAPEFGTRRPEYIQEMYEGRRAFIGPLAVPDEPRPTWPAFYGSQRLAPLLELADGALPSGATARIERVIERLPDLCGDAEPPARLHGDLWSGNVMVGPDGAPWLVDPAAYGGHREIDLAMLQLFGSPSRAFFDAYEDVAPLAAGWRDRVDLYQLLPLLVHAAMFGGHYGAAADRAASRYS